MDSRITEFAAMYEAAQRGAIEARHGAGHPYLSAEADEPNAHGMRPPARVFVVPGPKYTKVDFGSSGKLMIENATGAIFGIKGYGKVNRAKGYGTLDTTGEWDWSGYSPSRIARKSTISGNGEGARA